MAGRLRWISRKTVVNNVAINTETSLNVMANLDQAFGQVRCSFEEQHSASSRLSRVTGYGTSG